MLDTIIKEYQFAHRIDKVWEAISEAEKISAWFIKADFKAEKGYHYTFIHEQTKITGTVLEADPVYKLIYTWIVGGTEVETKVKWFLEENKHGTKLTLEHSGISNYPRDTAMAMFNNFKGGWDDCVENLEKYLDNPNVAKGTN